ncbi:MAG: M50 family metallopeptidase [Candidatus Promineifilaceae bacterium]
MFIYDVLAFFLVLGPIVLIHELGHFIAALRLGVRVEEFGLGLPPRAATLFERSGIKYTLNWLPLGGFVRPAGEDDPSVPDGLAAASKRVRFTVLFSGPVANFLLAFALFWVAYLVTDVPVYDDSRVAIVSIDADLPAAAAGLLPGDVVLEVNGQPISDSDELVAQVQASPEMPLTFVVERDGERQSITVLPAAITENDTVIGRIGAGLGPAPTGEVISYGPLSAAGESVSQIGRIIMLTLRVPVMLLRGEVSIEEVGFIGPPNIARASRQSAQMSLASGDWFPFLSFVAFINVALGFTNLLPIPALDGGRILFVLLEALRGRRVSPEREATVHMVAIMLLLGLMVFIFVHDLMNPIDLFAP